MKQPLINRLAALFMLLALLFEPCAQASQTIVGRVVSVDRENGTIVIQDDRSRQAVEIFTDDPAILDLAQPDQRLRVVADQADQGLHALEARRCRRDSAGDVDPTGTRKRLWKIFHGHDLPRPKARGAGARHGGGPHHSIGHSGRSGGGRHGR